MPKYAVIYITPKTYHGPVFTPPRDEDDLFEAETLNHAAQQIIANNAPLGSFEAEYVGLDIVVLKGKAVGYDTKAVVVPV